MVDQEVEEILKQIRDKVRAEEERTKALSAQTNNGNSDLSGPPSTELQPIAQSVRSYPNLATMNRAWDRLPPVLSNRRGALASLDLWLKRILKRGSRWFTWEQVNFNAAVHHTFREVIETLGTYEQQLSRLSSQLNDTNNQLQRQQRRSDEFFESYKDELKQLSRTTSELLKLLPAFTRDRELAELRTKIAAVEVEMHAWEQDKSKELLARANESLLEIRASTERILDEQRVCFKQITLETEEASARGERERRALHKRIAKLEGARESSSKASSGSDS